MITNQTQGKGYRPDGTEIKDDKNKVDTLKVVTKGAITIGAGYIAYRVIRFLPSLLPPLWPTAVPNQYILTSEGKRRYYCPELIYNTFAEGYIDSWISFDFNKDLLKVMPFNQAIVQVSGFIIAPDLPDIYNTFFKPNWYYKNLETLLKKSIIYFNTANDFDYFSVASRIPMEIIIKKWQEGLDIYDQE